MQKQLSQEAVELFKAAPVYDRLLRAVKQRYQSLGRIGGTVTLTKLTPDDREALSRFFARNFTQHEQVRISLQDVAKALAGTRFAAISLVELLEVYFGETLATEAEVAEEWQQNWHQLFAWLLTQYPHEYCQQWLSELLQRSGAGYKLVLKLFNTDREVLRRELDTVCAALTALPVFTGKRVRLPIFAAEITRDPHGFDLWTNTGHLLQAALISSFRHTGPLNGEEQVLLYNQAGILKGGISSYVTTYGLLAYQNVYTEQNSQEQQTVLHPLWNGALMAREVLQLTLDNIIRVEYVTCTRNRVYVVENPAVFSELVEACGDEHISLICSNGQLRLATWLLLDMLVAGGAEIYYSGDFDPEGLGIAQRLVERYPGNVILWHYTLEDYEQALSEVELREHRLKKLARVTDTRLAAVKEAMINLKLAGYQEQLVDTMVSELQARRFSEK